MIKALKIVIRKPMIVRTLATTSAAPAAECKVPSVNPSKTNQDMKRKDLTSKEQDKREDMYGDFEDDEDYVQMIDPITKEYNPPRGVFKGAEPTRYGDWEQKGRCTDF